MKTYIPCWLWTELDKFIAYSEEKYIDLLYMWYNRPKKPLVLKISNLNTNSA